MEEAKGARSFGAGAHTSGEGECRAKARPYRFMAALSHGAMTTFRSARAEALSPRGLR